MNRETVVDELGEAGTAFAQDDYFKIDPEAHLVGRMETLEHFPGVRMWWKAIDNIRRPLLLGMPAEALEGLAPDDLQKNDDPEALLAAMDRYGVDLACLLPESMMDTTGYSTRWVTNGDMALVVERHPDRFLYQPNLSPILHRGVKNAIWELEYWVKEKDARIFKFYPPEDTYINDPGLWPFYERAEALGIVLDIHTGFCWVPPGKSKHALPLLLDDVARDFPGLRIVAFHMGYPYTDDLNMVAMGHPNVHVCLSLLVPWALSAPRKFARILGEALRWVGPDRIIWGTDCAGFGAQIATAVRGLREFQIPEDLREGYGYPEITDDDRRKIFGLNLARLIGIEPKRRVGASKVTS
ncbi:MAG: amidohydrolase family protein [Deltaproteobacteria bacterium]|nr:amidohydrolase family protein [Deltaproteobacteria bacterium]